MIPPLNSLMHLRQLRGEAPLTRADIRDLATGTQRVEREPGAPPLTRLATLLSDLGRGQISRETAWEEARSPWLMDAAIQAMHRTLRPGSSHKGAHDQILLTLRGELILSLLGPEPDEISLWAHAELNGTRFLVRTLTDAPPQQEAAWYAQRDQIHRGHSEALWARRAEVPHLAAWLPYWKCAARPIWIMQRNWEPPLPDLTADTTAPLLALIPEVWNHSMGSQGQTDPIPAPGLPIQTHLQLMARGVPERTLTLLETLSLALAATGSGQLALGLDADIVADAVALGQLSRPLEALPEDDHTIWTGLLLSAVHWPGLLGRAARQVATVTLEWPHDLTNRQVRAERAALREALDQATSDALEHT